MESFNLVQSVDQPTHFSGHILDLVITRKSESIIECHPSIDYLFSDHFSVLCTLNLDKPVLSVKEVSYRKIYSVDMESFRNDILSSDLYCSDLTLCKPSDLDLDSLVTSYNTILGSIVNQHAPVVTKSIISRSCVPWLNR